MINIMHTAILVELPVITAAFLAVVGWLWRRSAYNDDQQRMAMAKQSEALAVLVERQTVWRDWQAIAETRINRNSSSVDRLEVITQRLTDIIDKGQHR